MNPPTLVVIPTYNEASNVLAMIERVRTATPQVDLLIVDDNSPDGTAGLVERAAASDSRIHLLLRPGKAGLGAAYRAGFSWALERDYQVLVEMDADGSHQPEQLPRLLAAIDDADLVIGSRWVPGGAVVNWPVGRKILSLGGNLYTRICLGISIRDATGGFRAFRASAIQHIGMLDGTSQGYVFQVDNTYRAVRAGLRVVEVPIEFVERTAGQSKMSRAIIVEAMASVTWWSIKHRLLRRPLN